MAVLLGCALRVLFICALVTILLQPRAASAWGNDGHEIVAWIADRLLTQQARSQVQAILRDDADENMEAAATWLDRVRRNRPNTAPWHFVNIDIATRGYDASRDCPHNQCSVAVVPALAAELTRDRPQSKRKVESLKALIHVVGDMHQPLHNADRNNDRGGNDVRVVFFNLQSNLHKAWDTGILQKMMGDDFSDQFAAKLGRKLTPQLRQECERGTVVDWANEGHKVAKEVVYRLPQGNPPPIGDVYMRRAMPVVERQLLCGGVRLAKILNQTMQ